MKRNGKRARCRRELACLALSWSAVRLAGGQGASDLRPLADLSLLANFLPSSSLACFVVIFRIVEAEKSECALHFLNLFCFSSYDALFLVFYISS